MSTITVYNRGKRAFHKIKNAEGTLITLDREGFIEMDEVEGLRFITRYPKELTSSAISGPSASDLKRREQSIRDREKSLDEREAKLIEREKALQVDKPRRGRPPKSESSESDTEE